LKQKKKTKNRKPHTRHSGCRGKRGDRASNGVPGKKEKNKLAAWKKAAYADRLQENRDRGQYGAKKTKKRVFCGTKKEGGGGTSGGPDHGKPQEGKKGF